MDLSYDDDIDTLCRGCGASAAGWAFGKDGRRIYVCPDCAEAAHRYTPEGNVGVAPHPRAEFCTGCERLTFTSDLNHQRRCPDCLHGAGDREEEERDQGPDEDAPPEVAAAQADMAGQVDWDEDE